MIKYFLNNRNFFHGIMFHHFHNNITYKKSQGSISKNQFNKIIKYIGRENILDANIFLEKAINKKLKKTDVCITFDDGLKCQYDIAYPVLEKYKIKAFFFIYTSIFTKQKSYLEVFREFRHRCFRNIDEFYSNFFKIFEKKNKFKINLIFKKEKTNILNKKKIFPFYTINDIFFRTIRDNYLDEKNYKKLMIEMMKTKKFNFKSYFKKIYISPFEINNLYKNNHIIGLHSHNHPTNINILSKRDQLKEYRQNINSLTKIIKSSVKLSSMSHPCGIYNFNSINILKKLNVKIGFRSNMKTDNKINKSNYEIAREDHSNILKEMNENL